MRFFPLNESTVSLDCFLAYLNLSNSEKQNIVIHFVYHGNAFKYCNTRFSYIPISYVYTHYTYRNIFKYLNTEILIETQVCGTFTEVQTGPGPGGSSFLPPLFRRARTPPAPRAAARSSRSWCCSAASLRETARIYRAHETSPERVRQTVTPPDSSASLSGSGSRPVYKRLDCPPQPSGSLFWVESRPSEVRTEPCSLLKSLDAPKVERVKFPSVTQPVSKTQRSYVDTKSGG